jgi:N-acetylneuraminate synthase
LGKPISGVMNESMVVHSVHDSTADISASFSTQVAIIPLVENSGRLTALALERYEGIQIGEHIITDNSPCFVIAEIGNNHNGDIDLAKRLVDLAVEAGADCAKFQMRNVEKSYRNSGKASDKSADLGTQYTLDLLKRFQLSNLALLEVFDYCKSKEIIPLCTPWDLDSLVVLENYGMEAYKVASADLTNNELLEALAATGKPLICSTGMSTEAEIKQAVIFLRQHSTQFVMLHCNSTYPTPFKDVNLHYLSRLKDILGSSLIGYSGHERGYNIPVVAVGLGARIIEKHFSVDRNMEGNDHKVSLLPDEFKEMVIQIRLVEEAMGSCEERTISQGESINREILAKSLVINRALKAGEIITRDMIAIKSPGQGIQPYFLEALVGKKAQRDFLTGDYFFESDIHEKRIAPRHYSFRRPFGIPIRYHDYKNLISGTNVNLVEFHLSYRDLEEDIGSFFDGVQDIGFAVHSPELFARDHVLDLCSKDQKYRAHSIAELQRVVDITRQLKEYFRNPDRPVIVINTGGFNEIGFLPKEQRPGMYTKVAESLDQIDSDGVELIVQTMPPFPWHFGGQSYHNLFVNPDEISEFCTKTKYRICLDISHSQMACNYYKWSLDEFVKKVGKYTAHLHVVDALGVDGEGIQIGKGDVDFVQLGKTLDSLIPDVPFISEIWQGHKQHGAGFWMALEFLENYL